MFKNVTPEKAIAFTKLSVALSYCWPLSNTATKLQIVSFKIAKLVTIINATGLFVSIMYALYLHYDDFIACTKLTCLGISITRIPAQIVFYTIHYDRLRELIDEMIAYCKAANLYERDVFQRYLDKYATFYGIFVVWFYVTAFSVIVGTLFTQQPFPTLAEYPFPVNYEPMRTTIFLHQSIVGIHVSTHVSMNVFASLLILFAAARFEILQVELSNVTSLDALVVCLKKYYKIRRYAQEVANLFWFVVLLTVVFTSISIGLSTLNLIGNEPFTTKIQFIFLIGTAIVEVFVCVWPADDLIHASESVIRSTYELNWYEQPLKLQRTVLCMSTIQKPVIISISCVVPALSLNYYSSYVSNVFSFFTMLRTIMQNEDEGSFRDEE